MSIFLAADKNGYDITCQDVGLSLVTGFTAMPYGLRHWELSRHHRHWLGHKTLAIIECIPVIGVVAAVIERISFSFFYTRSVEDHRRKMRKNGQKAIIEHKLRRTNPKQDPTNYGRDLPELVVEEKEKCPPLSVSCSACGKIGGRDSMEDAHFFKNIDEGLLAGVFDGHRGDKVAHFACGKFEAGFSQALKNAQDDVYQAFKSMCKEIQAEIKQNDDLTYVGSTAVVSYIDTKKHVVYTATVGDSEARVYRMAGASRKAIPLSCVRDWKCKKEFQRALRVIRVVYPNLKEKRINAVYQKTKKPKHLRYPFRGVKDGYINVCRSFGDLHEKGAIISDPKISMNSIRPGDVLILSCDGLIDYVKEEELEQEITKAASNESIDLAEHLVNFAVTNKKARDNVTVVALKFS